MTGKKMTLQQRIRPMVVGRKQIMSGKELESAISKQMKVLTIVPQILKRGKVVGL
jgi:hypothetical protein